MLKLTNEPEHQLSLQWVHHFPPLRDTLHH
jgi:hypothetical protein